MQNRFFLEHSLEMALVFDETGKIIYANSEAVRQLEYDNELYGHFIGEIFPGSFEKSSFGFITDYTFGETNQMLMAYRANKTCFRVEVRILQHEEDGEILYYCMMRDVSAQYALERKAAQVGQEAEAAMKVKNEFVANVTHELRTPVNGIQGNINELIGIEEDSRKLKILHLVERGCTDMHNIINNILDFSKLEAGKFTLDIQPFHFRNMIDYVKANHKNRIIEKGLDFFVTISPEIPEQIIGDELRVVQILNNLLSNATKFTIVGKVSLQVLKTAQKDNQVELFFMVMDTGIGIDKADRDKLFKSFSQVDASISRKFGGTGLGLNICKQLVDLMGGSITLESEKNKGTIFSFSLWFEVPEGEETSDRIDSHIQNLAEQQENQEAVWQYGTPESLEELDKMLSKLILSVEMDNWEKAEMFMESIKQLTESAPKEIKSAMLRLKMAVQKADYDKTIASYEKLQILVKETEGKENG